MNKWLGMLMILFVTTVVFTGCETTKGAGEDLQNLGQEVDESL